MLAEKDLPELLKEDGKVVSGEHQPIVFSFTGCPKLNCLLSHSNRTSETKALDGEMKTLVYENYSKFISATETIKTVIFDFPPCFSDADELTPLSSAPCR